VRPSWSTLARGNDKERPHKPRYYRKNWPYLANLAAAGFVPEDIDYVLCTHLHVDHVGWNTRLLGGRWVPTFPNARYLSPVGNGSTGGWPNREPDTLAIGIMRTACCRSWTVGQAELVATDYAFDDIRMDRAMAGAYTRPHLCPGAADFAGVFGVTVRLMSDRELGRLEMLRDSDQRPASR